MTEPQFREKFIAYLDILGFKAKVESAEHGTGLSLSQLLTVLATLEDRKHSETIRDYGPRICPKSRCIQRDLEYRVTQISDCAVVSAEESPAGIINVIAHTYAAALKLLTQGMMVRGYITRGNIYHEGNKFIGTGYQKALEGEKSVTAFQELAVDGGTPFVEIDPEVVRYINDCGDPCVKEMFTRMTKSEGDITVIFPYKRLVDLAFANDFSNGLDKSNLRAIRSLIHNARQKVESFAPSSDQHATRKSKYYLKLLNDVLEQCEQIEKVLDSPFPGDLITPESFPGGF